MEDTKQLPVLIAGAGPTGLVMALWLERFNIPYRLVDRAATTGLTSRALAVHARTLEFYRQLGIVDEIVAAGKKAEGMSLWHNCKNSSYIHLAGAGKGLSRYPYLLSLPQDTHEAILERTLKERGGSVERGVEVVGLVQREDGEPVEITLRKVEGGKEETLLASYVVGCDGARSAVRHATGIKMEGGTYAKRFFVADVQVEDNPLTEENLNMCTSTQDFCVVLPLNGKSRCRIVGFVPEHLQDSEHVEYKDVVPAVERNAPLKVTEVNWFSHYRVHHRMADQFKKGNVFLCGDAAHLHSPVGGQGMNTGLGDAANLAWKLAAVYKGYAPASILDTFAQERMAFAKRLVNGTDYIFTLLTGDGYLNRFFRNWIVPLVAPTIINTFKIQPVMYSRVSQILIEYRQSAMSQDSGVSHGSVKAGDRLPFVELDNDSDNFASFDDSNWQGHVYGDKPEELARVLLERKIPLHVHPWSKKAESQRLSKDTFYLMRPDAHVGLTLPLDSQSDDLTQYLEQWGVHPLI